MQIIDVIRAKHFVIGEWKSDAHFRIRIRKPLMTGRTVGFVGGPNAVVDELLALYESALKRLNENAIVRIFVFLKLAANSLTVINGVASVGLMDADAAFDAEKALAGAGIASEFVRVIGVGFTFVIADILWIRPSTVDVVIREKPRSHSLTSGGERHAFRWFELTSRRIQRSLPAAFEGSIRWTVYWLVTSLVVRTIHNSVAAFVRRDASAVAATERVSGA